MTTEGKIEQPAVAAEQTATLAPPETTTADVPSGADATEEKFLTPPTGNSKPTSLDIDQTKPEDFVGELNTTNELPSDDTIKKIDEYSVLDKHGKSHTFKSLYNGKNVARRVLVIFVRHFFCGNCQEYLRTFSESITPDSLLQLPISTFVVVIGCGDPALIDMYAEATNCPFPIYTDPKRALFDTLGMVKTLGMGERPAYMKKGMWKSSLDSIVQGLKQIPKGLALKSGDSRQVGGEFLFEPLQLATPVTTPVDEAPMQSLEGRVAEEGKTKEAESYGEAKKVTWCHRMKTTRDHAEIPELMEVLGLDGQGKPISDNKRWTMALQSRKGTGLSMGNKMGELGDLHNSAHKAVAQAPVA